MWIRTSPLDQFIYFDTNGKRVGIRFLRLSLNMVFKNEAAFYLNTARARLSEHISEALKELEPDYVISETCTPWYIAKDIARAFDAKLVLRVHSIGVEEFPCMRGLQFDDALWLCASSLHTFALAHLSDWTLVFTEMSRMRLGRALIKRTSVLEPTYVSLLRDKRTEVHNIKEIIEKKSPFFFGYEPKRIYLRLARALPEFNFIIAVKENELKRVSGHNKLPENIVPIGCVFEPELPMLFEKALAFLIPDICFSGICVRLLEGLYHGVPIITTNFVIRGVRGLKAGFHVLAEDDFLRWPSILRRLASDEEQREELREQARAFFKKRLRPALHGRRLKNILEHIPKRFWTWKALKTLRMPQGPSSLLS